MEKFSQKTLEALQYYVYCLIDPRDDKIFYVGKGLNNRVFQHAKGILDNTEEISSQKLNIIHEIRKTGMDVVYYILRHGIPNQEIALEIESTIIDLLDFLGLSLSNIVSGHHSWNRGLKRVEDIEILYSAKPLDVSKITDPLLVIDINKNYQPGKSLKEITSGDWRLNQDRANRAKYIIAEYRGILREVYKANKGWEMVEGYKKPRYKADLVEVLETEVLGTYLHKSIIKNRGAQNPISYINCK